MNDTSADRWSRVTKAAALLMALVVAVGAGVATAEGLYSVARMSGRPPLIAGLYPLITDGLAIVAYGLVPHLSGRARWYAAGSVVLAAGLSGLAQAMQMVNGPSAVPPVPVRFGIGAWPAVAVLLAAHLWWLAVRTPGPDHDVPDRTSPDQTDRPSTPATVTAAAADRAATPAVDHSATDRTADRARQHFATTGTWPSKSQLATDAGVSPTTAQRALQRAHASHANSLSVSNGRVDHAST